MLDTLNKDGGFGMPATATTGIQSYDQEGSKKPKKSKKKPKASSGGRGKPVSSQTENGDTYPPDTDDSVDDTGDEELEAVGKGGPGSGPKGGGRSGSNSGFATPTGRKAPPPQSDHTIAGRKAVAQAKKEEREWHRQKAAAAPEGSKERAYHEAKAKKFDGDEMNKVDITELDEGALAKFFDQHKAVLTSGELVKGVYDVAQLGSLISQLKYMADNAAVERQIESDGSTVPESLRDAAANLLGVLSDMASEESEEIKDGTTAEDVMRDTQPTMTPGLYRSDVGALAKAMRTSLFNIETDDEEELVKAGARNSKKDMETLQKCHDALCELGATCAAPGPHAQDGKEVQPQEVEKMTNQVSKTDTVSAEGNKRGSSVTDPKLPANSTNEDDAENTSDQGQEKPTSNAKKSKKRMDADEDAARKAKARAADEDEDEDDDEDEDEEEDFPPPKAKKKAKKADENVDLAKMIATAVGTAVATAMAEVMKSNGNGGERMIPRVAPNLMQVGKGGEVQKIDIATLHKSVDPVAGNNLAKYEKDPTTGMMVGDNDTARLIKAIHKSGPTFRLSPNEIPQS